MNTIENFKPYEGAEPYIFISYAHADSDEVLPVVEDLYRRGYNIWYDCKVNFVQAALGDSIMVPTIDGKVKFDLPAGTQPGTVMSLKGKGIQYLNSRGRGDQYIRIIVEVPKDLTAPQREALKNFKDTMGYSDVTPDEKRGFFGKKKK